MEQPDRRLPNTPETWTMANIVNQAMDELSPQLRRELAETVSPESLVERRQAERESLTDELTQLANRRAFERAVPTADADPNIGYAMFDGDNFGEVNKALGQSAGDALLRRLAESIKGAASAYGVGERVFRIGGDEFAVIGPADAVEGIARQAVADFGVEPNGGYRYKGENRPGFAVSLTGASGATFDEAQVSLKEAKASGQ